MILVSQSVDKAVGPAAVTQILALSPHREVVTAFRTWGGPIGHFVSRQTGSTKDVTGDLVAVGLGVAVGCRSTSANLPPQRRSRLDREGVGRDVIGLEAHGFSE